MVNVLLFSDTDKVGKLPPGYEHLCDGADVLRDLVHIPDIVFEEDEETKGYTITFTSADNKEEQFESDLIVIASVFDAQVQERPRGPFLAGVGRDPTVAGPYTASVSDGLSRNISY